MVIGVSSSAVTGRSGNPLGRWFDDRKVRSKILIAVGAVAVAGIVAGFVGVSKLGAVYAAGDKVVTDNLVPAQRLADARIQVEIVRIAVRDIFIQNGAAMDAATQKMADADAALDADIAAYAPVAADPVSIEKFQTSWTAYRQARDATLVPAARTTNLPVFVKALAAVTPLATAVTDALAVAAKAEATQGQATAAAARTDYQTGRLEMILVLSIGILLALCLALYAARRIVMPLRQVSATIDAIVAGNLTATAGVYTRDEVGAMASALDAANARTRTTISAVADTANTLASSSEELSTTNRQVAAAAEQTGAQATAVAAAAEQVSGNVQTVAAGSEQMSASIPEIAQSSAAAARVADTAVHNPAEATPTRGQLGTT
ncbi:MAG: methyl-accepting chemotaxis protein, partial [Actinoplanes sp.]|nr:methyl-accepting chemotaxis protein [Actinoplanes sp.]